MTKKYGQFYPSQLSYSPHDPYSDDETEFILAMERYQRERRRRFPTYSEVLAVIKKLGYKKDAPIRDDGVGSDLPLS